MAEWWDILKLFGGGSGSVTNAPGTNDPNLGPSGWSDSGAATWNPSSDSSGGVSGSGLVKALGTLASGTKSSSGSSDASSGARSQNAALGSSAGFSPGKSSSGLDALIQEMQQRRNRFFVGGGGGSSGSSGLLG